MKVNLSITDGSVKTGMFSSIPCHNLNISVELTEVEAASIKKLGLEQHNFFFYTPVSRKEREGNLMVWESLNGARPFGVVNIVRTPTSVLSFSTLLKAQDAMGEIKEGLKNLKSAMDRAEAPTSESFEL